MAEEMSIGGRLVGPEHPPLVVAEIGVNHEGSMEKAIRMIDDAIDAGCECVKFQSHVIDDEMIPNDVVPGNTDETIWAIMARCAIGEAEEAELKRYVESKGAIFLSTPFSRAAAVRLERLGVSVFKIGSGECNNYPLLAHIASYGKPVILSTGMNDIGSVERSLEVFRAAGVPVCLLHCTSIYPTPYEKVRLGAIAQMREAFGTDLIGLSDHSLGNYTCFGAVALGACVIEKHFISDKSWPGPDVPISIDPTELRDLIVGSRAIYAACGGRKGILEEEAPTIAFAYASVVSIRPILAGEVFSRDNLWVKRPGTGEILAADFEELLGKVATRDLDVNEQIAWSDVR